MSPVKERSFWSTTSGFVTGVAGTLTGIVGIVTLAVQMGWIGGGDGGNDPTKVESNNPAVQNTTTLPGARSSGGVTNSGSTTPVFHVEPTSVTFETLGSRDATVKVFNDGSAAMTVQSVKVEGTNASQFGATASTCTGRTLAAGRSCDVEVKFTPTRSGTAKATLVIQVASAPAEEVPLTGTALI